MPPEDFMDRLVASCPALRRQAAFLIGARSQIGSPEDYVQDTIVTALQTAHRFEEGNLFGWLVAILDSHIRNASRRAWARTSVPLSKPSASSDDDESGIEIPIAATQDLTLDVDDVLTALRTLSEADQEIIRLARLDGLSHEQIAERLDLPLGTLHARLSRATARLRAVYEAEPEATTALASTRCCRAA
jgi:RNA polymerase sigma-70 factor (ECF subfamily)